MCNKHYSFKNKIINGEKMGGLASDGTLLGSPSLISLVRSVGIAQVMPIYNNLKEENEMLIRLGVIEDDYN